MIDIETLCIELNVALPAASWPLDFPMTPCVGRAIRYATATWSNGAKSPQNDTPQLSLHLYERIKEPVYIIVENKFSSGLIQPDSLDAEGIVNAMNEYRWIIRESAQ